MKLQEDHEALVRAGLQWHEARCYAKALRYFERASRLAPNCPVATYNRANTLHMLGREAEAYAILRELVRLRPEELGRRCLNVQPSSLQLDAYFLLFWVVLYYRGFCAEAFNYAAEHLRRRRRGLHSAWSLREVRADIAAMQREWTSQPNQRRAGNGKTLSDHAKRSRIRRA